MALTERERKIVERAFDVIARKTSADGDVLANITYLRNLIEAKSMTLGELLGAAEGNKAVEALTKDRNRWRRAAEKAQRDRTAPANAARTANADDYAAEVARIIQAIEREHRNISTDGIAEELTRRKVATPLNKGSWTRVQVHRVMRRAGKWQ